jgi:hypothetical protein
MQQTTRREIIKAPDGSGDIFWRKGKEGEGPEEVLNWVMWFRRFKIESGNTNRQAARLPIVRAAAH